MQRVAAPLRVRLWSGAPAAAGALVVAEAGALRLEDGPPLRAAPPDADAEPRRGTKHAAEHLLAAFKAGFVDRATVVASAGGAVDVEVTLQLPVSLWTGPKEVKHAAAAFLTWHALAQARLPAGALDAADCGDCGCVGCEEHTAAPRAVSLRGLLEELPLLHDAATSAPAPPLQEALPCRQRGLCSLDEACVSHILAHLDLPSLRAAAQTCRSLAALSLRCAPGLRCTLYAHQRAALAWMLRREARGARVAAPLALGGAAGDDGGWQFVAAGPDGPVHAPWAKDCPALEADDARGGFYCDEPGLGKTVTLLALMLRTRGMTAAPPPEAVAVDAATPPAWYDLAPPPRRRGSTGVAPPRRVWCTRATLVVVPDNLISHWEEQAALHAPRLRIAVKPDSIEAICAADVVLSSFQAFSAAGFAARSPLLSVRWLRVVLDEGHTIWSAGITNRLENLLSLHSERRWVMTGTPAPERAGTGLAEAAKTLLALLQFVRDPQYGLPGSSRGAWVAAVERPLAQGRAVGVERLRRSLGRLTARATKACLRGLPPCVRLCTRLDFTPAHAAAYNQLVLLTMRALLLADWGDERCAESLLHKSRSKDAATAVAWVRQACSVAGKLRNNIDHAQVGQALDMLSDADSDAWRGVRPVFFAQPRWAPPTNQRLDAIEAALLHGGACELCGHVTPVALVTPCAHIICVPCGGSSQFCCPLPACGAPYTMQHGRVPQDFVELQPAMIHAWQSDWHFTRSSKVRHVLAAILASHPRAAALARQRALRWRRAVAAAVGAVEEEHEAAAAAVQAAADAYNDERAAAGLPPAPLPPGLGPPPPRGDLGHKCHLAAVAALRDAFAEDAERHDAACDSAPHPKFILYSPFLGHLQLFATHLAAAGVRFAWLASAQGDAAARRRNVAAFKADPTLNVLLMDKTGVLGHDLSCASRVILLEPVRDAAEARQVEARAHRLGCRAAEVRVETLAMRGTAEEQLLRLCEEAEAQQLTRGSAPDAAPSSSDDVSLSHPPAEGDSALEKMQNRELLRTLAFVRPAAGDVEAPPELAGDATARRIEAVLTNPREHAKALPPPAPPRERAAASGSGTPPRTAADGAAALGPTSPDQPEAPPHSAMRWD